MGWVSPKKQIACSFIFKLKEEIEQDGDRWKLTNTDPHGPKTIEFVVGNKVKLDSVPGLGPGTANVDVETSWEEDGKVLLMQITSENTDWTLRRFLESPQEMCVVMKDNKANVESKRWLKKI
mmetsp:Transcript_33722/g.54109  ORF Transcript_33722/g.54109 Transcript_33722/m.54109 type:complete len:122 (+) Transcript_33722:80-445(+)